ncbi:thioredoxin family protein (plasmid) [Cellulomonas sp. WB94]|uniref:thioredoxin family protein n=1 Tax=Cellulomonas sp. WB94 TaxID=2173174 RepID=UPI000D57ADAB|nr:thioredoxin family protein [Cellulomonas sp. WB94]PVU81426.1 thioredoxin family protein [Cellulomonas sp. WB94]
MEITLLYFDGCPNWEIADQRLAQIASERPSVTVTRHRVETTEEAERTGFHGSPSILVNGVDAFAGPVAGVGLACRLYATPEGLAGAPTLEQLREAVPDAGHIGYGIAAGAAPGATEPS